MKFFLALIVLSSLVLAPAPADSRGKVSNPAKPGLQALPMRFEPNVGQFDERVRFLARGKGYGLHLTDDGATLSVASSELAVAPLFVKFPGARRVTPGA